MKHSLYILVPQEPRNTFDSTDIKILAIKSLLKTMQKCAKFASADTLKLSQTKCIKCMIFA